MNSKVRISVILFVVIAIVLSAAYVSLVFFNEPEKKPEKPSAEEAIDDQISPLTNQGLTVEILRIRHRGLLDKMLTWGTSWRQKPTYYWISIVDGEECNSGKFQAAGGVEGEGTFNDWDTILHECRVNYDVPEEQETSDVKIKIVERVKTGLFNRKTEDVVKEIIHVTYDYRTGHWSGNDKPGDSDGYGHYLGETFEVWFNIYQADYDHDGIPYWAEVNVIHTDPTVDDSNLDPDKDGIPTAWEWRWGYDPHTWDDHRNLDPDVDGIENIEEYQMRNWFADPYRPDIYIEADGMEKGRLLDWNHVFYKESQQMIIERFCQHGINVYIDDGWPGGPTNGGGELLPFVETLDDVVGGHMKCFYDHHFPDERRGIFRYLNVANNAGFCTSSQYNYYDHIVIDTSVFKTFVKRRAFTPRYQRVALAKGVLHELGHSFGLMPYSFKGVDICTPIGFRYPSMPEDEYKKYLTEYYSIMNYHYIFRDKKLFDYSHGENGEPYDQNDWEHLYLPAFQCDALAYEEPVDETFEDFEVVDENIEVSLPGWEFDENLTQQHAEEVKTLAIVENTGVNVKIYVKTSEEATQLSNRSLRVYVKPDIDPFPVNGGWSLVGEGYLKSDGTIEFYSSQKIIDELMSSHSSS